MGDLGRAIPLYEQTLTDIVRVLGADHPSTLVSRNNLAGAYQAVGDLGRAIALYEQTLTDTVRVLGADHPSTLGSRNNLAGAYQAVGESDTQWGQMGLSFSRGRPPVAYLPGRPDPGCIR